MAKAQKGAHTRGACRVVTNMGEDAVGCADCDAEDDKCDAECRVHEDREGALIVLVTDENQSNEQVAAGVKERAVAAITFPRRVFLVLV